MPVSRVCELGAAAPPFPCPARLPFLFLPFLCRGGVAIPTTSGLVYPAPVSSRGFLGCFRGLAGDFLGLRSRSRPPRSRLLDTALGLDPAAALSALAALSDPEPFFVIDLKGAPKIGHDIGFQAPTTNQHPISMGTT